MSKITNIKKTVLLIMQTFTSVFQVERYEVGLIINSGTRFSQL